MHTTLQDGAQQGGRPLGKSLHSRKLRQRARLEGLPSGTQTQWLPQYAISSQVVAYSFELKCTLARTMLNRREANKPIQADESDTLPHMLLLYEVHCCSPLTDVATVPSVTQRLAAHAFWVGRIPKKE